MGTKKPRSSRRDFLKSASLITGATFATLVGGPVGAVVIATEEKNVDGPWYGHGIDLEKCIGCGRCAKACKVENNVPDQPYFFRTWIEQYTIKNDETVHVESPNGGMDGFDQKIAEEDIFKSFFVPKMCNHCHKSPCIQVCPVGATFDSPEGVVLVDEKYCIGCGYCVQACPYGCRYFNQETKVVDKCTFCYHRLKKGLAPACMEVCPTGARIYGDLRDEESELVEFLKENNCQVLKPHLNTGAKLYYNALSMEVR